MQHRRDRCVEESRICGHERPAAGQLGQADHASHDWIKASAISPTGMSPSARFEAAMNSARKVQAKSWVAGIDVVHDAVYPSVEIASTQ